MKIRVSIAVLGWALTICALAGMPQTPKAKPSGAPGDVLGRLKSAFQTAGAPLTSEQETSILNLIQKFREAHQPPLPPKENPGVEPAADQIGQHEADMSAFETSVLGVLTASQSSALVASLGEEGVERLLRGLAGGPGRFGPGRGGPGRGGPGFPGGRESFGGPGGPGGPPPMAE
jgi:hypothetical protein